MPLAAASRSMATAISGALAFAWSNGSAGRLRRSSSALSSPSRSSRSPSSREKPRQRELAEGLAVMISVVDMSERPPARETDAAHDPALAAIEAATRVQHGLVVPVHDVAGAPAVLVAEALLVQVRAQ